MSRLYDIKVDDTRWKVVEVDNKAYHSYKIIDKKAEEIYFLNHIIGMEQVEEEEFLVYRRANYDYHELVRYRLQNSDYTKTFEKMFNQFYSISKDRLMFTYSDNKDFYRCGGFYSIKDNKMLEDTKWLEGCAVKVYKDDEKTDKINLYVEKAIRSEELRNPKVLFTVDSNTFEPNSDCYSQLRDSFIKVDSKEDILKTIEEDKKYAMIIEERTKREESIKLKNAREKILTLKPVNK